MPADPALVRQYQDLQKRCANGKATPAACAMLVDLAAAIDAGGGPPAGMEIIPPDKLRPLKTVGMIALGAYLLSIAARFFRGR